MTNDLHDKNDAAHGGMLWQMSQPKQKGQPKLTTNEIVQAVAYFESKYTMTPRVIAVNSAELAQSKRAKVIAAELNGVRLAGRRNVLPGTLWLLLPEPL